MAATPISVFRGSVGGAPIGHIIAGAIGEPTFPGQDSLYSSLTVLVQKAYEDTLVVVELSNFLVQMEKRDILFKQSNSSLLSIKAQDNILVEKGEDILVKKTRKGTVVNK